jgi:nucleolar protein 4
VEFSIENIQVTKRRNAASQKGQAAIHADSKTSERKLPKDDSDVVNIKEPPVKKRKTTNKQIAKANPEPAAAEAADPKVKVKPANPLGALIGRKRKERKSGKKGGR